MDFWKMVMFAIVWWISGYSFAYIKEGKKIDVQYNVAKRNVAMYMLFWKMLLVGNKLEDYSTYYWYPLLRRVAKIGEKAWDSGHFDNAFDEEVADAEKDM